jgi:hypothetical protein
MRRERTRKGDRKKPVTKEPAINAIWKMRRGVGRRYVLIIGIMVGHSCWLFVNNPGIKVVGTVP